MKVNAPADATYEWAGKQRNTVALGLRIGLGMGVSVDWERLELDLVGRSSGATIVQPAHCRIPQVPHGHSMASFCSARILRPSITEPATISPSVNVI